MVVKPEPLDLDELKKKIYVKIKKRIKERCESEVFADEWVEIFNNFDTIDNEYEVVDLIVQEIFQHIRSACKFYLKYKDKPELLVKERPDKAMIEIDYDTAEDIVKEIHRIVERYGKVEAQATIRLKIIEYNEWLFKLSFKDVLENEI